MTGIITFSLIGISILVTLLVWSNKSLLRYGMNREFLSRGDYTSFWKQAGLFQFIHGDVLHIVMNCYFLFMAGPAVESILGGSRYLVFFITTTFVTLVALYYFAPKSNTIGISNFCMALLSYLWIGLYSIGSPDASEIGTLLLINIALGFIPGISLVGHAAGALWGAIFFLLTRNFM